MRSCSNKAKQETEIQFTFGEEGKLTVQVESQTKEGWIIEPLINPCIVSLQLPCCRNYIHWGSVCMYFWLITDQSEMSWTCPIVLFQIKRRDVDLRDPKCGPISRKVRITVEQLHNPPTTPLRHTISLDGISPKQAFNILFHPPRPPPLLRSDSDGKLCMILVWLQNMIILCVLASGTSDVSPYPQLQLDSAPAQWKFYKMVVKEIPAKWHTFGVMLDINSGTLDGIDDRNPENCFLKVFSIWQSKEPRPFTWSTALDVLHDMDENRLFKKINKQMS